MSHLDVSRAKNPYADADNRSAVEREDINKLIRKHQGPSAISPRFDMRSTTQRSQDIGRHGSTMLKQRNGQAAQMSHQERERYQYMIEQQQKQEYESRLDRLIYEMYNQDIFLIQLSEEEEKMKMSVDLWKKKLDNSQQKHQEVIDENNKLMLQL